MAQVSGKEARTRAYDVCVIGAGAAGLALAGSLGRDGLQVLVIERGGFDSGEIAGSDSLHEITFPETHDPRGRTNRDAVGGTLHGWGGRCMPFDPEDFDARHGADAPGWPIPYAEYARWIAPAAAFLQTDARFEEPMPTGWSDVPGLRVDRVERLNAARQVHVLQDNLRRGETPVDLLQGADLVATTWEGEQGSRRIAALELHCDGRRLTLPCRQVVLACGGLETTRQLLLAQAVQPEIFGGPEGALGRHYMGHLTGSIAEITFRDPALHRAFGYRMTPGLASPYRRRFVLSGDGPVGGPGETPANTAFWVENIAPGDPRHRSGELSFKHLLAQRGRSARAGAHLSNILRNPLGVFDALRSVSGRLRRTGARRPPRLVLCGAGPYALAYHAEHFPMRDSRVTLSDAVDSLGRRKLRIDFRYGDRTIQALIDSHERLARRLDAAGIARLDLPSEDRRAAAITDLARDGYHQIGLTRMSLSPADGVVDRDCRVHGTHNLFVASASIFPVSGQANPTLSVIALALRLADSLIAAHRKGLPDYAPCSAESFGTQQEQM